MLLHVNLRTERSQAVKWHLVVMESFGFVKSATGSTGSTTAQTPRSPASSPVPVIPACIPTFNTAATFSAAPTRSCKFASSLNRSTYQQGNFHSRSFPFFQNNHHIRVFVWFTDISINACMCMQIFNSNKGINYLSNTFDHSFLLVTRANVRLHKWKIIHWYPISCNQLFWSQLFFFKNF